MVKVILWGGIRELADGTSELKMEANSIQELVAKLGAAYPGLQEPLNDNISVAVDGHIYRDSWFVPLDPDAEVFLLPRLAGG